MIEIVKTNVATIIIKEFSVIKEAPAFNIFLKIIYITVLKLLAIMFIIVWILDSSTTKYIIGDLTKFLDLTTYKDFCYTTIGE